MTTLDPKRAQLSVFQIYGPRELIFGGTSVSIGEPSARWTRIPELAPILGSLDELHTLVQHVSWNFRSRCLKLISQAVAVLCDVCYHHEKGGADRLNPAIIVEITTVIMEVKVDFRVFKEWSVWRALRMRRDAIARLKKHKENLNSCLGDVSVAAALHSPDGAADAQRPQALNNNQSIAPEDEQIPENYPPSELAYYLSSGLAGDSSRFHVDSGAGVTLNDVSTTASSEALQYPQVNRLPSSEGDYGEWTKFITAIPGQFGRVNIKFTLPIHGSFSDVSRGSAKLSDERVIPVAVKKFRAFRVAAGADESAITHKLLERLKNDLDILMAVQHPNIARVIGFFLSEGLGIISPWYANGNVATYVGQHPEVDRVKLVSDVAQGLAYLHGLDPPVVHGDLKPDNVLIANTGSAVIIDFRLSSIMENGTESAVAFPSTASTSLEDARNIRWMAPELFMEGSCTRSPSTDVYSFGSVSLFIFTGKLPFTRIANHWLIPLALEKGQNPVAHRDEYTALFAPGIEWLYKLLLSCWDLDPNLRPSMGIAQETIRSHGMKGPSLPRRSNCRHNPPYHTNHVTTRLDFDTSEDDECPLPRPGPWNFTRHAALMEPSHDLV